MDNHLDLFCVLMMGEGGNIVVFSSGNGSTTIKKNVNLVLQGKDGNRISFNMKSGKKNEDGERGCATDLRAGT